MGGVGNTGENPRFVDADGIDNIFGTPDDNLMLFFNSPSIDSGDNDAVPFDFADLDDDGDTSEILPYDFLFEPRQQDDPVSNDVGNGAPPLVDMGVFEFGPTSPGKPGPRLWVNAAGGGFEAQANWFPDTPAASDGVVFDLDSQYTVTFGGDAAHDYLYASRGEVTFNLSGQILDLANENRALTVGMVTDTPTILHVTNGTLNAASAQVGGLAGSFAELSLGSASELNITNQLHIGEEGAGIVHAENALISAGAGVIVHEVGTLSGVATVQADVVNTGIIDVGNGLGGVMNITGSFIQGGTNSPTVEPGEIFVDINGTSAGSTYDVLSVDGYAMIAGTLVVALDPAFNPQVGDTFTVLLANNVTGQFQQVFLPALEGSMIMTVHYDGTSVMLSVEDLAVDFFAFGDPLFFELDSVPTDGVSADFDQDGDQDFAFTIPHPDPGQPGSVVILRNLGNDQSETGSALIRTSRQHWLRDNLLRSLPGTLTAMHILTWS